MYHSPDPLPAVNAFPEAIRPQPDRGQASARSTGSVARLRHIAVIGNFPPRQCGLATFTRDIHACLRQALPAARIDVIAMNDADNRYDYPAEVTHTVAQQDAQAYRRLARELNLSGVQAVFVQHEFGIYGGPAGKHLIACLEDLSMPVITTLHTLLETPDEAQREVMQALIRLSSSLVVMSRTGAELLQRVYGAAPSRIHVIPHGAPTRPLSETAPFKAALGLEGHLTLTTFGLLSPNKGIETIIDALPDIVARVPQALYLVVGATHPHLLAAQGEAYREGLMAQARALGVENHIRFINRFVDDAALIDILQATDVYVTPYLTEAQITSGTLSYALALGRPVVSTPYWHAREALADGVGVLCGFADSAAFAAAISELLAHPEKRRALSRKAYEYALPSCWPAVAKALTDTALADIGAASGEASGRIAALAPQASRASMPRAQLYLARPPSWRAIERMSDDCGLLQHGKYRVANREHGYCTDDNARALSLIARQSRWVGESRKRDMLAYAYAAFVNHAWLPEAGRFRNFMSYGRQWLDEGGSDDCCARALEALADVAESDLPEDLQLWARELGQRVLPHAREWRSHRARAIVIRALATPRLGEASLALEVAHETAQALHDGFRDHARDDHKWFEPHLSYDNARLSEGLLLAGEAFNNARWRHDGLESLRWLMQVQTCPFQGHFRPVPTSGFAEDTTANPLFDQQPLEAIASIEACLSAWRLTQDPFWRNEAQRTFGWFFGENDHGQSLITADGGCFDGLTSEGCNQNQGAESLLAYHLSWTALMGNN